MTSLKGRIIGVAGGLAVVLGGVATTAPTITAHAANACPALQYQGSGIGLNPIVSQSDFLATPSTSYNFAGVCGFSVGSATAPSGNAEKAITVTLDAGLPAFPDSNGDVGVTVTVCADMSGGIASTPQIIGYGHRGQPVYDGPWPAGDGWKYCTYATIQAGVPFDYGLETFNPNGSFTFTDWPLLKTPAGAATMDAPSNTLGAGTTSVTLYLPDTMTYLVPAPQAPLQGPAKNFNEPYLGDGTAHDLFALTQVNAEVTLPFPVCVNLTPPGISCNNNQLVGPIFGIAGVLATSGWAPGQITCNTVGGLVPNPLTCGESGTGGFKNAVDLGILPLPFEAQAIATPCVDPLDLTQPLNPPDPGPVDCAAVGPYVTNYFPCQSTSGPNNQDVGDGYALLGAACPTSGSVPLPGAYVSSFGNIWPGDPGVPAVAAPSGTGQFTYGPAFLFSGING